MNSDKHLNYIMTTTQTGRLIIISGSVLVPNSLLFTDTSAFYVAFVQTDTGCLWCKHDCVPGLKTLSDVLRAVYCTYPVPLHAHTHFLATVRPALVLHRVRSQTLTAPLLLTGLWLAQDLGHALLVHIVQTLINTRGSNKCQFSKSN